MGRRHRGRLDPRRRSAPAAIRRALPAPSGLLTAPTFAAVVDGIVKAFEATFRDSTPRWETDRLAGWASTSRALRSGDSAVPDTARAAMQAWNIMGGLDWQALPIVVDMLGISDPEDLILQL